MDDPKKQRLDISLKSYVIITVIICLITMVPLASTRKSLYKSWMKNKIQDNKIIELEEQIKSLTEQIEHLKKQNK